MLGLTVNLPVNIWFWTYNNERPNMDVDDIIKRQKLQIAAQPLLLRIPKKGRIPINRST